MEGSITTPQDEERIQHVRAVSGTLVTIGAMYVMVRQAMRPVVQLTSAADQISMGEGLDAPIKSASLDEIGVLTKSIDRLRASMKAAMSRLGH